MSNRLFQGIVHQMRDAIDRTVGVIDESGAIIACSDLGRIGEDSEITFKSYSAADSEVVVSGRNTYKSFGSPQNPEFLVFVEGTDIEAARYAAILALSLSSIKYYYDENYDRGNFIKNIILDNILPGDIYLKARELRFNSEVSRTVLIVRVVSKNDISVYDVLQNIFPDISVERLLAFFREDRKKFLQLRSGLRVHKARGIAVPVIGERVLIGIGVSVVDLRRRDAVHAHLHDVIRGHAHVFDGHRTVRMPLVIGPVFIMMFVAAFVVQPGVRDPEVVALGVVRALRALVVACPDEEFRRGIFAQIVQKSLPVETDAEAFLHHNVPVFRDRTKMFQRMEHVISLIFPSLVLV